MMEVLLLIKPKSPLNSSNGSDSVCSECHTPLKNLPISDTCKICQTPICTRCGYYTSSFDIYCEVHSYNLTRKAKKIGKNHYYSPESGNDFFMSKSFR